MRSPNWFLSHNLFVSAAAWKDRGGAWMILPAIWGEFGLESGLDVRLSRWTVGWCQWRAQLDVGRWRRLDPSAPLDWEKQGLDDFLAWSRRIFGKAWGRPELEKLFMRAPEWRKVVVYGDAHAHYIRVLLAREMMAAHEAPIVANSPEIGHWEEDGEGADEEGGRANGSLSSSEIQGSMTATDSKSMLDGLSDLGNRIGK